MDLIFLDLRRVVLYGFQEMVLDWKLDRFVHSIEDGREFPPVYVVAPGAHDYELADNSGGHHRAAAHYIAGMPLRCVLLKQQPMAVASAYRHRRIPIQYLDVKSYPGPDPLFDAERLGSDHTEAGRVYKI